MINRNSGLDFLRIIAIVLVMVSHSNGLLGIKSFYNLYLGNLGVEIFFILSGFLITSKLRDLKQINLVNFYLSRALRIIPNFYLSIIVFWLANLYGREGVNLFEEKQLANYFFFFQNIVIEDPLVLPTAWSLSVEVCFYLLIPVLMIYFKHSLRTFIYFFLVLFIIKSTVIFLKNINFYFFTSIITRIDSIFFGSLTSIVYQKFKDKLKDKRIIFFLSATLSFFLSIWCFKALQINSKESWIWVVKIFYFLILDFGIILLFPLFFSIKLSKIPANFFKFFAHISYGLYLYHISVLIQVHHNLGNGIYAYKRFWFYSILISTVIYFIFEKPIFKLKTKYLTKNNIKYEN